MAKGICTHREKDHVMKAPTSEISRLLESQIANTYSDEYTDESGRVLSIGDGIARVYGLHKIQAGEMVEFSSGVKGMALNLESENVGVVLFGSDRAISEGDSVKRTGQIVDVNIGPGTLGRGATRSLTNIGLAKRFANL